jgi:nucleotide sugar dehydrogenase
MSTPIIHVKPEDLNTTEKRRQYTVCIIGCGQAGILHAMLFAEAGFKVICFDSDQTAINSIAKGKAPFSGDEIQTKLKNHVRVKHLIAANDIKEAVTQSNIIAITIPEKVDSKKKVDHSTIENMCKRIGPNLQIGSLIILAKPVGIGIVEGTVKDTLENSSGFTVGKDIGLAYSPLHSFAGKRIVAAMDNNTLNIASTILESITESELIKTGNMKAAEAAALFDIQQHDVTNALANELALFCEKTGVDFLEVNDLLESSSGNPLPVSALSDSSGREESYLLFSDAENLNIKLRVAGAAREVNEQTGRHVVSLVKDALGSCGKTPRRARIALLGISQTPNMKSPPKRVFKEIAQVLASRGARINLYDPYFSEDDLADAQFRPKKSFSEAVEGADCVIILTGHEQFKRLNLKKLKIMMKKSSSIVDLQGVIEPDKVEKEGFIYRGLGRGVWTK